MARPQPTLFNFFKVTKEKRAQSESVEKPKINNVPVKKLKKVEKRKIESCTKTSKKDKKVVQEVESPIVSETANDSTMLSENGENTTNPIELYALYVVKNDKNLDKAIDENTSESIEKEVKEYKEDGGEKMGEDEEEEEGDNNNEGAEDDIHEHNGLSDYEKLRLDRIKQNSDYLDSLGLENVKPSQPYKKPKKRQSVNKRKNEMSTAAQPMRRSTRHISVDNYQPDSVIPETSSHENKIKNAKQVEVEEFEDSDVLTYLIDDETKVTDNSDIKNSQSVNDQSRLKDKACHRLERLKYSDWNSFNLGVKTRWYSIHSDKRSGLVVAGGQGGRVSTFRMTTSTGEDDEQETSSLFSFKPHGSTWVSDVLFCGDRNRALASLLLTSANDGNVMLWDLTKQAHSAPKLVNRSSWHDSGIWSMHTTQEGMVCTGSKDGTVSFGNIRGDGLVLTHNEDLQLGHVKSVNINSVSGLVAAACEEGGSVMMLDTRAPTVGQGRLHIKHAHGGKACMSVEWRPGCEHTLLSAGLDATIKVWDVRKPSEGLHTLSGHIPSQHENRLKQISRPRWLPAMPATLTSNNDCDSNLTQSGDNLWGVIAVQGEHTTKLTLYDALRGDILSRGELGSSASTIANVGDTEPLVAVGLADGTISFLVPE